MRNKLNIDDGFNSELVRNAYFSGIFEIPTLNKPKHVLPRQMIPFSKRKQCRDKNDSFIVCYEHEFQFAELIKTPQSYVNELLEFAGCVSPDCSLYFDSPLSVQLCNIYRNRAVAYYLQEQGVNVIPNVRWGDERTFTDKVLPEKIAFIGIPQHSIVSVGSYGCLQEKEYRLTFQAGLESMVEELLPEIVLVYGSMPNNVFGTVKNKTNFIQYHDWLSLVKGGNYHGDN